MAAVPEPTVEIIRRLSRPLAPEATGETPVVPRLAGIRAVLFDVYGTLFISASGDIDAAVASGRELAFDDAAALCGLIDPPDGAAAVRRLNGVIEERHEAARAEGNPYPEVDIVEVWKAVFADLSGEIPDDDALRRFATVYENLVNPVWPMPGCRETLLRLQDSGLLLGLVSNAQFYTLPMFPALLDVSPAELGLRDELVQLSYRLGCAKPGRVIYERTAAALAAFGVTPGEALLVGNDLLNDVAAAAAVGFRTALFAGDRRSLRKREGDPRVAGVRPDAVITELRQLPDLIEMVGAESLSEQSDAPRRRAFGRRQGTRRKRFGNR